MNDDELHRRVERARVGRLATVRPDGSPHVVPVCFAVDGDEIVTAVDAKPKTTRQLARLANIEANARVSLVIDEYDDQSWRDLWWVRADGSASIASEGVDLEFAVAMLREKYRQYRTHPPTGPAIMIAVDRWTGWSASGE